MIYILCEQHIAAKLLVLFEFRLYFWANLRRARFISYLPSDLRASKWKPKKLTSMFKFFAIIPLVFVLFQPKRGIVVEGAYNKSSENVLRGAHLKVYAFEVRV